MTQKANIQLQKPQEQKLDEQTPKKITENHLSSSAELILKYEAINFQIEDATKSTRLSKSMISESMKEPLVASTRKKEQIFQKYGTMIENQPMFLRQLIYENYTPYLPYNFKKDFSEIMMLGGGFEAIWWGSLVVTLFKAYRNRRADIPRRQKTGKGIGIAFLFVLTTLGFHNEFYIPKLKSCFYRNIKSVDSLMDRHLKILQASGSSIQQEISSIHASKKQAQQLQAVVPSSNEALKKDAPTIKSDQNRREKR